MRRATFVAALLALALPVRAAPVAKADAQAIRRVIQAQLAAFAADDAEAAFSHAAPAIREMFGGSAQRFMEMVRTGYPVVYRPASVAFLVPEPGDAGKVLQRVQMTDAAGAPWDVVYELERQKKDKAWRITACVAQRGRGTAT